MRTMNRLAVGLAAAAVLLHAGRAWAPFHVVVIDQVFFGSEDCPNAQYVMMRLAAPGMVFVQNQTVRSQNADGSAAGDFGRFSSNLDNGASGDPFVIGTADAAGLFGLTLDETTNARLILQNGRVCFGLFGGQPVDCVAYGDFTGDNAPRGQPAASPPLGMALVRQSNTNNNAADFTVGAPAPRNNAGQTGTLGQCPSVGDPTPTVTEIEVPTATATEVIGDPTPTATTGPATGCTGDCNGDRRVIVNELITGVGIALESQPLSACPSFDLNGSEAVEVNELIAGVRSALEGCPATPLPTGTTDGGQPTPSATPTTVQQGALGVRRFTVDPEVSRFEGVFADGAQTVSIGWQGFLELRAGIPDANTGVAFIDVTDASDYLAIDASSVNKAICIRVRRDQLPVEHAGIIACNGGVYGVRLTQNHSLGVVGRCMGSADACSGDGDCGAAQCFTAARCTAAGGTVEGATDLHPGVCNGPFVGELDTPASPPGTVFIASDPDNHTINGLPVEIADEQSLPCGDEGVTGRALTLTLTSDHAIGGVTNADNQPGATILATVNGQAFSCDAWTQEDGPGVLVLSAPTIDTRIAPGVSADIVANYVFAD